MPRHSAENPYLAQGNQRRAAAAGFVASLFTVAVLAVLVSPLAAMFVAPKQSGALQQAPAARLVSDGHPNARFLSDAGAWFESHIGFRDEIVTADAYVHTWAFGTSNTEDVVVGRAGWLFLGATMDDYLGRTAVSDASLDNVAFNVLLLSRALEAKGIKTVFAIAPNKNSVYPEWMPFNYVPSSDPSPAERLSARLQAYQAPYTDLFVALGNAKSVSGKDVYYAHDSHWNGRGARAAAEAFFNAMGYAPDFTGRFTEGEHVGDLDRMLYPAFRFPETCDALIASNAYNRVGDTASSEVVQTERQQQMSEYLAADEPLRLLFLGDSFAEELVEPMASEFAAALFTMQTPVDFSLVDAFNPDVVVVERAERDIPSLVLQVPNLPSPEVTNVAVSATVPSATTCSLQERDGQLHFEGVLDRSVIDENSSCYLELSDLASGEVHVYEAWRRSILPEGSDDLAEANPNGFEFIVGSERVVGPVALRIIGMRGGVRTAIYETTL